MPFVVLENKSSLCNKKIYVPRVYLKFKNVCEVCFFITKSTRANIAASDSAVDSLYKSLIMAYLYGEN